MRPTATISPLPRCALLLLVTAGCGADPEAMELGEHLQQAQTDVREALVPREGEFSQVATAIRSGGSGAWDWRLYGQGGGPGAVIRRNGGYLMYYIGFDGRRASDGGPAHRSVGLARSDDGIHWTKHSGNPVITHSPSGDDEEGVWRLNGMLGPSNEILLYATTLESSGSAGSVHGDIRLYTSSDGTRFVDRGVVVSHTNPAAPGNDELGVCGTFRAESGAHYIFYTAKGGADWLGSFARGPDRSTFNRFGDLGGVGKIGMGSDPVRLSPSTLLTIHRPRPYSDQFLVMTFDEASPTEMTRVATWTSVLKGAHSLLRDDTSGRWLLYAVNSGEAEATRIDVYAAPVRYAGQGQSPCGDGTCSGGESCASCPGDCGPCTSCGDGTCSGGEGCASCPGDCGPCSSGGDRAVTVSAVDESDGQATLQLLINGQQQAEWRLDADSGRVQLTAQVRLADGDRLAVRGFRHAGERARVDKISVDGATVIEAEDMDLRGYVVEPASSYSGGARIALSGANGTAETVLGLAGGAGGAGGAGTGPASSRVPVIVDDADSGYEELGGGWKDSGSVDEYRGQSRYSKTNGARARWTVRQAGGRYQVAAWWTCRTGSGGIYDRDQRADYNIYDTGGRRLRNLERDQRRDCARWNTLGTFTFSAGAARVELVKDGESAGSVSADAVKLTPVD